MILSEMNCLHQFASRGLKVRFEGQKGSVFAKDYILGSNSTQNMEIIYSMMFKKIKKSQ